MTVEHQERIFTYGSNRILADYASVQTQIPADFWTDLKAQKLIEQNAPIPA